MKLSKVTALALTGALSAALLAGCGGSATTATSTASATTDAGSTTEAVAPAADAIQINVGYENATTEPAAKAVEKWKELVEEKSGGSIVLNLFPNSSLGKKVDLIDQMVMGQNVITVADGAFLAEYGVPDFGIFYAPFMFESWDEEWAVIDSDWYGGLCDELANAGGIRVVASNWIYGARDIISTKKVVSPADLSSLKMRVSSNDLSITSFTDLGANALGMDMGDVYQALQAGTIDAVENPITSLANRSFQEVAKYLVKDEHILATSMWVCGESFYQTLTAEQQQILCDTAAEAGLYNNELYDAATEEATQMLIDAGVEITELTADEKAAWMEAGQKFYDEDAAGLGWSEGLYDTVKAAAK